MPAIWVNFGGDFWGPEALEKQGRKLCGINWLKKSLRKLRAISRNPPDINKNSTQIRSAEPLDQKTVYNDRIKPHHAATHDCHLNPEE